jgi:hypothetical protein
LWTLIAASWPALAAATADRNNVYAGVRAEQIASLAAEIAKAKSRLEYAEQQLTRTTYLTGRDAASPATGGISSGRESQYPPTPTAARIRPSVIIRLRLPSGMHPPPFDQKR